MDFVFETSTGQEFILINSNGADFVFNNDTIQVLNPDYCTTDIKINKMISCTDASISATLTTNGFVYGGSPTFINSSLVTKLYVDNAVSGVSPFLQQNEIAFGSATNTVTSNSAFRYINGTGFNIGNATTTNQRLVRIGQDTSFVDIGSLVGNNAVAAIYLNTATPSTLNFALSNNGTSTQLNAVNGQNVVISNNNNARILSNSANTTFVLGAGAADQISYQFTIPTASGNTATTEFPGFKINGSTAKNWNAGTISTQREFYLTGTTYTFVGASTITNAYGMYVEAGTAGTNATITNNWALGTSGNVDIAGSIKIVDGTQASGYVLTSDANGNGSWQPAGGGGGSVTYQDTVRSYFLG